MPPNPDAIDLRLPSLLNWIVSFPSRAAIVVFTILMIYQAALPGGLTLAAESRTVSLNVFPSETFRISKADVVGNVVPYWIYGHFVFLMAWRKRPGIVLASLAALAGSVLMAIAVESVQLFNLHRGTAIWDIISGVIGGLIAMVTGSVYVKCFAEKFYSWVTIEIKNNPLIVLAVAMAAVMIWDAARPFYVISSGSALIENVKRSIIVPFTPRGVDIREQLDWILSGRLLPTPVIRSADYWGSQAERCISYSVLFVLLLAANRANRWTRPVSQYLLVLVLVEVIAMLIVRSGCDITHLVVGAIAAPIGAAGLLLVRHRSFGQLMLLATFVAFVLITDLRPYQFGDREALSHRHFIPLYSHVQSPDVMMLANIVEAIAVYAPIGTLLHLPALRDNRDLFQQQRWPSLLTPVCLCAAMSLVIECVQLWMPARTSNIEDVLYSGLGGYVGASAARIYVFWATPLNFRSF